jgi:hypothetical protein
MFSGGAALRLDVECLEAELADLGPTWVTECCPAHLVEDLMDGALGNSALAGAANPTSAGATRTDKTTETKTAKQG